MIKTVGKIINSITMYRLVLYCLISTAVCAIVCGFLGIFPYSGISLVLSLIILIVTCYGANWIFSKIFKAITNVESWLITAMILFFLFIPISGIQDSLTLFLAGIIAMASKYILAIKRQHLFNPSAIAAVLLGFNPNTVSVWWVGSPVLIPIVLLSGLLVVSKIRKFSLFNSFIIMSLFGTFISGIMSNTLGSELFMQMVMSGPFIFLGTIMLTEPLITPPTKYKQMIYGGIVGVLHTVQFNLGPVYSSPELALIIGNIYSYFISPKNKLFLHLKEKRELAKNIYEFVFSGTYRSPIAEVRSMRFRPGQYMEWTLPHHLPDSRGVRRYFSIASSPDENGIRIGVRIGNNPSSFKRKLLSMDNSEVVIASGPAGDFVLPNDIETKMVFIAGGIGVTPFISMVNYLLDKKEKRSITLIYFSRTEDEISYKDIFERAEKEIGTEVIYVLTDPEHVPVGWKGKTGRLDNKMLSTVVPDYKERTFYLSGPDAMVNNYKNILLRIGIKRSNIKKDYFPGY